MENKKKSKFFRIYKKQPNHNNTGDNRYFNLKSEDDFNSIFCGERIKRLLCIYQKDEKSIGISYYCPQTHITGNNN
jgi:hypothetical protein